jgi:regulator of PEP synthase PpsR (kinase-PPPase family)
MARPVKVNLFVVSDGTGTTAESVLTSVVVQFPRSRFNIQRFPFTRTREQLQEIITKAPRGKGIIVFTLVSEELRAFLTAEAVAKNLMVVDVMGPLISSFSHILKNTPRMKPGIFRNTESEQYIVNEAIHYTLGHDDGLGSDTLDQADLIILGLSRTGKTPTSIYLSCRKLKVANIPIINPLPLAQEVIRAPAKKVGFFMSLERLVQLRGERLRRMSYPHIPGYASEKQLLEDLEYCKKVFRKIPSLKTIDVTNRSTEEISEWITRQVL